MRDCKIRVHGPRACRTRQLAAGDWIVSAAWTSPRRLDAIEDDRVLCSWVGGGSVETRWLKSLPSDVRRKRGHERVQRDSRAQLAQCPCCAARTTVLRSSKGGRKYAECLWCGLRTALHSTAEDAAAAWNRRPAAAGRTSDAA